MRLRLAAGLCLLAFEAFGVFTARLPLAPSRTRTRYVIGAAVGTEGLTEDQMERRYRLPAEGVFAGEPAALFDRIERAEAAFEKYGRSRVYVRYAVDGGPEQQWRFPH